MTGTVVRAVEAREILDSRGDPTVRVAVETGGGRGVFGVPSGASTGRHEAVERRDGGERYRGRGVRDAVRSVNETLGPLIEGRDATDQRAIDDLLCERDGTADLSRFGANAVLGVSGAVARAAADTLSVPLYEYLDGGDRSLPVPMVNVVSGGLHAVGGMQVQDVLVVPSNASSYSEALEWAWAVRAAVRDRIVDRGDRPLVADEGGFAPQLDVSGAFDLLIDGTRDAGFAPGEDVHLAVDVAASHFYDRETGEYVLSTREQRRDTGEMVELVREWVDRWPVVSIEDPLAQDDWSGWTDLTRVLPDDVQVLGDDLLVTDEKRLDRAISEAAATAVLVKPNQTGTITRTRSVTDRARDAGWGTVISARSGETCDTTIADLAVALDAGQIKIGSLARSERTAKYNRLLGIERGSDLPFADAAPGR